MNDKGEFADYLPSEMMQRIFRWWWLVAVLIIVGGLAGYLFSLIQKPLYESTAIITTSIDFAYAGRLTDAEEDHLISAVGDLINSSGVMAEVAQKVQLAGFGLDAETLADSLTASRQGYRWELSSRFKDPETAKKVGQIWVDASVAVLEEMRLNSIRGLQEFFFQQSIETCFSQSVIIEPVSGFCTAEDFSAIRESILASPVNANKQNLLNLLKISRISFQVTQAPTLPLKPVQQQVNLTTFAGAIAGLIISIFLFLLGYPRSRTAG